LPDVQVLVVVVFEHEHCQVDREVKAADETNRVQRAVEELDRTKGKLVGKGAENGVRLPTVAFKV